MDIELLKELCHTPGVPGLEDKIAKIVQNNIKFLDRTFYDTNGDKIETKNEEIIEKVL